VSPDPLTASSLCSLVPKEMLVFAPPEVRDLMIDYYDFFAVAIKQNDKWVRCEQKPDRRPH
jgi:hypothetical protein